MILDELRIPIVQAPMAGGPSTPELAAAVSAAGALGFLGAGYKTLDALRDDIAAVRERTRHPFGVNVFAPTGEPADPDAVRQYTERLRPEAERAGVALGEPRFTDDDYARKLGLLLEERPAVVSFTFGCPDVDTIRSLQQGGVAAWITVTTPGEARAAADAGADALVLQGAEAGGHRGAFVDRRDREDFGLLALIELVRTQVELPLVAAGGIASGRGVAAVLAAGAAAAALGTAFMRTPEAATSAPHRHALASSRPTALTRAFTGRLARGIVNTLQAEHTPAAPIAYPELHYVTAPLRAHGRRTGDADVINLWAGQAHELARDLPAAELVVALFEEARAAAAELAPRFTG